MSYKFKIVQRNQFITNAQYREALDRVIEDPTQEWYIVSLDDYDEDFAVFAQEI